MSLAAGRRARVLTLAAPLSFALIWASSYVTAAIGLRDITPFYFVAIRLAAAAILTLGTVAVIERFAFPARSAWPHLLAGGALVHGLTLTTAHAALLSVKAAPIGLVHAFHPVLTAALATVLLGERFTLRQWFGTAVGCAGVALVLSFDTISREAFLLMGLSMLGLTGGTLYLKRFCPDVSPFEGTAVQIAGGALFAAVATALFEAPALNWTMSLAAMMTWNILVVSILAMVIYMAMLTRRQAGSAASAFFIVPGAAALAGYLFLQQSLSPLALLGLAFATFGVWLVWR